MLPRSARLRQERDISLVLRRGQRIVDECFIIRAARNQVGRLRLTVIVSKKIDRRATGRNLIKRRLRAVLSANYHRLPTNLDLMVAARAPAAKITFQQLSDRLLTSLRRLYR